MTDDQIRAALAAAAKRLCVCDGECFETRHGMMNGPCEARIGQAAAAVAAFHRRREADCRAAALHASALTHGLEAAAVERAAREGGDGR